MGGSRTPHQRRHGTGHRQGEHTIAAILRFTSEALDARAVLVQPAEMVEGVVEGPPHLTELVGRVERDPRGEVAGRQRRGHMDDAGQRFDERA